jgi:hypothetical protein
MAKVQFGVLDAVTSSEAVTVAAIATAETVTVATVATSADASVASVKTVATIAAIATTETVTVATISATEAVTVATIATDEAVTVATISTTDSVATRSVSESMTVADCGLLNDVDVLNFIVFHHGFVFLGFDLFLDNDNRSLVCDTIAAVASASGNTKTVTTVDGARESEAKSVTEIVAIRDSLGGNDNLLLNNDGSLVSETVATNETGVGIVTV